MKQRREVSIALPASLISDVPHLREKTFKIGLVGRAAAIYRIEEIIIFPDYPKIDQSGDNNLIANILEYMETPQYLRKRLFKIRPELRFVGVLPPLRTPHHPLLNRKKDLKVGEYREGVTISSSRKGSVVEIGVECPVLVPNTQLPNNRRVTVRITNIGNNPKASLGSRDEIKAYWGYRVTISNIPFGKLVENRSFDLAIATSIHGMPISRVEGEVVKRWKSSNKILVAFGAPTQGLLEIVSHERLKLDTVVHYTVNTIPNQGTQTVRTEEAIFASLAVLNQLANSLALS